MRSRVFFVCAVLVSTFLLVGTRSVAAVQFEDNFSTDSTAAYLVDPYWNDGGDPQFLYDETNGRLQVLTGDDIGIKFTRALPVLESGVFEMDLLPTAGYPDGSKIKVRLRADANNYYEVYNSDAYLDREVAKYVGVGGVKEKVASAPFQSNYNQGAGYKITIRFSPQAVIVEAFGETLVLDDAPAAIAVSEFEVVLQQQDAYIDNIRYGDAIAPPLFTDITASSGTGGPSWYGGHGVQLSDATGDGRPDFYVTMNSDQDMADLFYRNIDGASFIEEADQRGVASFDTGSHGGVWADLDNDGDYDLFNGAYQRNRIYSNNGSGFFTDVTLAANLPDRRWLTRGVVAFDMDKDGDLDLFAITGYQGTNDPAGEKNEVYRNEGNLFFTAVDSGALYDAPAGQGATDSDFDGDGDIDIIAANRTGAVNFLRNDGAGNFQLIDPVSLGINHAAGDGITLADVNNDGHLDLLLQKHLYINTGNNTYTFRNTFSAPGYMGGFEDLDNDGDFDLVFSGDNKVYLNDGSGNYSASPTFITGLINDPRSVAFADIEGDGDVDFFYAQKNTYNRLIRNEYQGTNRWLKVKLVRSNGQAGAFGAKVYVYKAGQLGVAGSRITWREARSQEGYLGQNDSVLHFGVGQNDQVDVRVVFLGGATVEESFVPTGRTITMNENGIVSNCALDPRFGQATLAVGLKYYTDRDYVLTAVPSAYAGMAAITTPNEDRDLTAPTSGYLTFEMPFDGKVYVGYDSRTTGLPAWMNGFADTGDKIETSLASQPYLKVYGRNFTAGECVNLGANKAAGFAGGTVSSYIVFYGASGPPPACALNPRFGQATLAVGLKYYTDRDYVLTAVPSAYAGLAAITTPNDDRDLTTSTGYLTFEMPFDGTVYVAYDSRTTGLPAWMNGFADTGARIETSLASQPYLKVYGRNFTAGECVNLGANKAAGFAGGTVSNYIVFYGASGPPPACALDPRFGQATLAVGLKYYTDRDYVLSAVPSAYAGLAAITTPNDDRDLTTPTTGYLTFEMPFDGTVYVGYDSRTTALPAWMNGFADTGARIETSLASQPYLKVYGRNFTAGECVNLGANKAAGFAGGTVSSYVVFYGASGPADETPPVWQGQTGICFAQDTVAGGSVRLNFGAALDDISGSNVVYTIYFAPTAVWNGSNWPANQKLAGVMPSTGEFCANGYTIEGLAVGTSYTFGVRAEDASGNEETNTNTATATPTGEAQDSFIDDFITDTRSEYTVDNYWTTGGTPLFLYDAAGQRLRVLTGDDVGVKFTHPLPVLAAGVFEMDFQPTIGYPDGGKLKVRLRADAHNYYEVYNSDAYPDRQAAKYVGGVKVDSVPFLNGYKQGTNYRITIYFSPQVLIVEAFGETLVLDNNPSAIAVSEIEVVVQQQDAYFDNVAMLDQAYVHLSSPMSDQFQSGANIAARAYAGNLRAGDGVTFVLRDFATGALLEEIEDYSEPYEHLFAGLTKGGYSVEALVIDSSGQPVAGGYTRHLVEPVGIGVYYVAFGDSITFGVGDDIAVDDVSFDGFTTGGGYAPVLADLLANHYGYPHFIANEGGPGDTSAEALGMLPGVLARHPESEFFLILLGSNDSFGTLPVPSGLDENGVLLNPGEFGYDGSFLDNMQQIIEVVTDAGKQPILGKVSIVLGSCSQCTPYANPDSAPRNLLIQEYNSVIDQLAQDSGISIVPPDFYAYFRTHLNEFSDNVHPDGAGYVSMANLWYQAMEN